MAEIPATPEAILVPTDGSKAAKRAADQAIAIATETGATLHALYVMDMGDASFVATPSDIAETKARMERKGRTFLEELEARAAEADLECTTESISGIPDDEIVAYAREHDVDLIVMGKRGRSDPDKMLVGSTTKRVIGRSEIPVRAV
jgi:nucleotide-binding universal stress UspA family protein